METYGLWDFDFRDPTENHEKKNRGWGLRRSRGPLFTTIKNDECHKLHTDILIAISGVDSKFRFTKIEEGHAHAWARKPKHATTISD